MKVRSISNTKTKESTNPCLSPNTEYLVVEISDEYFRVNDDIDEPILYPKELFIVIDDRIPEDWIKVEFKDEDGDEAYDEYHIGPAEFRDYSQYFYEKFFDGDLRAIKIYKAYFEKYKKAYG